MRIWLQPSSNPDWSPHRVKKNPTVTHSLLICMIGVIDFSVSSLINWLKISYYTLWQLSVRQKLYSTQSNYSQEPHFDQWRLQLRYFSTIGLFGLKQLLTVKKILSCAEKLTKQTSKSSPPKQLLIHKSFFKAGKDKSILQTFMSVISAGLNGGLFDYITPVPKIWDTVENINTIWML